jgi:hypothetical protein
VAINESAAPSLLTDTISPSFAFPNAMPLVSIDNSGLCISIVTLSILATADLTFVLAFASQPSPRRQEHFLDVSAKSPPLP